MYREGRQAWCLLPTHAELSTIHVGAEYRRSGVGMALLEAFAVDAARQRFSQLRLSVRPDNPARKMYEKAGFLCTGTCAHDYLAYERHA